MYAVEFRTKIKDGRIEIPQKLRKKFKNNVKVILLSEDAMESTDHSFDMIDELLASPLKLSDFKPMKREDIYDRSGSQ